MMARDQTHCTVTMRVHNLVRIVQINLQITKKTKQFACDKYDGMKSFLNLNEWWIEWWAAKSILLAGLLPVRIAARHATQPTYRDWVCAVFVRRSNSRLNVFLLFIIDKTTHEITLHWQLAFLLHFGFIFYVIDIRRQSQRHVVYIGKALHNLKIDADSGSGTGGCHIQILSFFQ